MVYQHIKGIRPISLEAAKAYAKGFNCSLSEISPRLADEIAGAATYADKETPVTTAPTVQPLWPFTWFDEGKFSGLKRDDLIKLTAAPLIDAAQAGPDANSTRPQ